MKRQFPYVSRHSRPKFYIRCIRGSVVNSCSNENLFVIRIKLYLSLVLKNHIDHARFPFNYIFSMVKLSLRILSPVIHLRKEGDSSHPSLFQFPRYARVYSTMFPPRRYIYVTRHFPIRTSSTLTSFFSHQKHSLVHVISVSELVANFSDIFLQLYTAITF